MGDLGVRRAAGLERVLRMHSVERGRGAPAFDPQLLISLWVYSYIVGLRSAREIARRCEWDPAFQWPTGGEAENYHTLADLRVERTGTLFSPVLQRPGPCRLRMVATWRFVNRA